MESEHRQSSPRGTPQKFGRNRGGINVPNRRPAISLKRGKIGPRLLLMTNRKSHTHFRLVPKSTILDDLEGHYALSFKTHVSFIADHKNSNEDTHMLYQRQGCSAMTVVSCHIRFMWIFAEHPWRRGVKDFGCYVFGNLENEANVIILHYLFPCRRSTGPKIYDLE